MSPKVASRLRTASPLVFLVVALSLTASALGATITAQCKGYCASLPAASCESDKNELQCCCKVGGVWTCVCRVPTDCTTGNNCQQ